MFGKNNIIEVHMNKLIDYDIKIKKNDINFNIVLKEIRKKKNDESINFVWFLHVELPKSKEYKLCAYGTKKFNVSIDCQNDAFLYLNSLSHEFYKMIKEI